MTTNKYFFFYTFITPEIFVANLYKHFKLLAYIFGVIPKSKRLRAFQEIFDEEIIPGSPLYNLLLDHYYPYKREIRVFQKQEILLHISPSDPAYGYRGGYNYTDFFLSYWYLYNFDPANIKMWVAREEKEDIQRFYKKKEI